MSFLNEAAEVAETAALVARYVEVLAEHPGTPDAYTFTVEPSGSKYRIVSRYNGTGASVHAFVDKRTGDIFKAASWKVAAKDARYNVHTDLERIAAFPGHVCHGGYLYKGYNPVTGTH